MSLVIHCDGPDCNAWIRNNTDNACGFLTVYYDDKNHDIYNRLDFCSWDCCMIYASQREPLEVFDA